MSARGRSDAAVRRLPILDTIASKSGDRLVACGEGTERSELQNTVGPHFRRNSFCSSLRDDGSSGNLETADLFSTEITPTEKGAVPRNFLPVAK